MRELPFDDDTMTDFESWGKEAEHYFLTKLHRASNLGFLAFCAGLIALLFSQVGIGVVLLLLAFHWDQQSNTYHIELFMTKYSRLMARHQHSRAT